MFSVFLFRNVSPVLEKHETALLLLLGFGGASICLAVIHKCIRRHVFHDADNVDTAFDAGGQVSTSLTAVTVASQLLWPADLLQGATVTVKVYIGQHQPHSCHGGLTASLVSRSATRCNSNSQGMYRSAPASQLSRWPHSFSGQQICYKVQQ